MSRKKTFLKSCSNSAYQRKPARWKKRSGVAAVEFAVVAPLLFLILFMMIETSRYLSSRHAVTGAARNIARMAAVTDISDSDLLDAAKTFLDLSSFRSDSTEVEVSFSPSNVPGMRLVTAEVRLDFSDVSLVGDPFNFNATKVRGFSTLLTQESP